MRYPKAEGDLEVGSGFEKCLESGHYSQLSFLGLT